MRRRGDLGLPLMAAAAALFFCVGATTATDPAPPLTVFRGHIRDVWAGRVPNVVQSINSFAYLGQWGADAASTETRIRAVMPSNNSHSSNSTTASTSITSAAASAGLIGSDPLYPFLEYVEVFTATGGCYAGFPGCVSYNDRDLFNDPADPSKGYNATVLIDALRRIKAAGLRPYVVTGNVPVALSAKPHVGGFGVNDAPPASFEAYHDYIVGVTRAMVNEFGLEEVAQWRFGVLTEYNNPSWYATDGNATHYLQLYDWTVCALYAVLGPALGDNSSLDVGAHGCVQCGSAWDVALFVKHVANGTNFCTGKRGSPVRFLTNSFYANRPGWVTNPSPHMFSLADVGRVMQPLIQTAQAYGLHNLTFGIDEGRILADENNTALGARAIGPTYQAAFDALLYDSIFQFGGSWYSRWAVNTNGQSLTSGSQAVVDPISTNVARQFYSLTGGSRLKWQNATSGFPGGTVNGPVEPGPQQKDYVGAVATVHNDADSGGTIIKVVAYNFRRFLNSTASANVSVVLCGLDAVDGGVLHGSLTRVDNEHGQFWNQWEADVAQHPESPWPSDLSRLSELCPGRLLSEKGWEWVAARFPVYRQLAATRDEPATFPVVKSSPSCVVINATLPAHGVHLFTLSVVPLSQSK